jgi:general secretion pathway protein H
MSRAGNAEAGFTLLEILVVLTIMALVALIAAPRFHASNGPNIRMAAQAVAEQLRLSRANAIDHATIETVDLDALRARIGFHGTISLDGDGKLLFFPDGSATESRIVLATGDGEKLPLIVDWLTGTVRAASG